MSFPTTPPTFKTSSKNVQVSEWEETGNAHTLTLMPEKAKIENEFTNEMCELYLDDLRQSILDWLAFIGE
ncbi:MAG TPA: hypothetical protein VK184_09665 [Nostocaceae cyanobacterium]|nr:hypothetical protein [Nostocaceae cyanobacterium]